VGYCLGFWIHRLEASKAIVSLYILTLCYFNTMFLFIMFLVCSSYMLDIVMIDDEFMHMFAKHLAQYSSELSGNIM
jgi:hypothetical protein